MSGAQRGRLEVLLPVRTLYLYLVARIAPGEKVCQGCIRTCSRLTSYHTRFYMTYIVWCYKHSAYGVVSIIETSATGLSP